MKKHAFSLIEVLVSIVLFSIILIFLYDSLDITIKSNQFYSEKLENKQKSNNVKKVFFSDLVNAKEMNFSLNEDSNKNSILYFQTKNTYHNPFYSNVTYLVTKNKTLMRIESKNSFAQYKGTDEFFKDAYIDILDKNIEKLKIKEKKSRYYFYIRYVGSHKMIFSF